MHKEYDTSDCNLNGIVDAARLHPGILSKVDRGEEVVGRLVVVQVVVVVGEGHRHYHQSVGMKPVVFVFVSFCHCFLS